MNVVGANYVGTKGACLVSSGLGNIYNIYGIRYVYRITHLMTEATS